MSNVITWNGREVPKELKALPKGRYLVEPLDAHAALTPREERDIAAALDSLGAGRGVSLPEARRQVAAAIRRGKSKR